MLVSVVIPAFGRPRTLAHAVASAASQSGLSNSQTEIIIVDDSSPEPISAPAGIRNSRVMRLLENAGAAGARNAGIEASRGEFIAFLDSDDLWLADKLRLQLSLAQDLAHGHDLSKIAISCGFYIPNRFKQRAELRIPRAASKISDFVGGCWMCPGSTLFCHRSVFDQAGLLNSALRRLEDYEWMLRFAARGGQLFVCREPGAIIAPSSHSKLAPVKSAVDLIKELINTDSNLNLSISDRQTLESYLELEVTAAFLGEHRRLEALFHLLKSFYLNPRLQASTHNYWERSNEVPCDVLEMLDELSECANQGH